MNFGTLMAWDWSDSKKTWKDLVGYELSIPNSGQFAGVLRGTEMECGANVKSRVAENMGVAVDNVE